MWFTPRGWGVHLEHAAYIRCSDMLGCSEGYAAQWEVVKHYFPADFQ